LHHETPFDFSKGANQECAQAREKSGVIAGPCYLPPLYPSILFPGQWNFFTAKERKLPWNINLDHCVYDNVLPATITTV